VVPKSGSVTLTQPVYSGGRTVAGTSSAENQVMAERARLISTEQNILLAVATAYMEVLRDQVVLKLNIKNEDVLAHQLGATRDQFEVGEVTLTDVSQAEARLARAKADRILAEGVLESSRAAYLNVVGVRPEILANPEPLKGLPATSEDAHAIALEENPDVVAAHYEELASRDNVREVTGELLPSIDIVGEVSRSRDSSQRKSFTDRVQIMAELTVPLYQAGSVTSRVREAKQTASQRRMEIHKEQRNAVESTTRAWESLKTARAQIGSIEAAIKANTIALEGVREEAKVGARTVLDILDAEQEYLDSRVALVRAQRDEFVAGYELMSAIGRLSVAHLRLDVTPYDTEQHYREVRNKFWGLGDNND
jgi:TolC family type I secretion outer membrane protein